MKSFWNWVAWKLVDYLAPMLQAGGHCGLCGKWVPYDVTPKYWAITLCDKCKKGDA
jgi:hypothetical protein